MDTAQLLQRCQTIGTSTWSDALDACGISGVVRGLVQRSGHGRFAGFAVTAVHDGWSRRRGTALSETVLVVADAA